MKSLRTTLLTIVLSLTSLIFIIQMLITSFDYQKALMAEIEEGLRLQAIDEAAELNTRLQDVGKVASFMANSIEASPEYNTDLIMAVLEKNMQTSDLIYGSGFWLEPFQYNTETQYYGPYLFKDGSQIKLTWEYSNQEYNYFQYDWYQTGFKAEKDLAWSEPFMDTVSNVPMMTAASPIDKDNKRVGVASADLGMPFLDEYMRGMKVGEAGYSFIITAQGFYLAHPDPEKNLKVKITEHEDSNIREYGAALMKVTEPTLLPVTVNGLELLTAISPIGDTGMKMVLALPQSEVYAVRNAVLLRSIGGLLVAIVILALILSTLVTRKITRPLEVASGYANQMAQGDYTFDVQLELLDRRDEIGVLAKSFDFLKTNTTKIIEVISSSAQQLKSFSDHLASSGASIAAVMEQTSASTEEIAAGMEEISSASEEITASGQEIGAALLEVNHDIDAITDSAREIETKALAVQNDAQESQSRATEVTERIRTRLQIAMDEAQVVKQITDLAQNIASIADQTNLLALNAAIEAARAGEHGRGFAVVAEEVRKLAEESAAAVDTIQKLTRQVQTAIQNLTSNSGEMLEFVSGSVVKDYQLMVDIGQQYRQDSNTVAALIGTVNDNVRQVASTMEEINRAIEATARTIQESTTGTQEIAKGSENAAQGANEINQIAQDISANVKHLNQLVQQFKVK